MSEPADRPQWPLGTLITLSVGVCLSVTTELLPTGLLPGMSRDLHVSEGTLGLLVTAYAVMVAVLAAPLAIATARFARRSLMLAILVGYTVSNLAMVVSNVYAIALGARLVGGVMHGLFWGMLGGYVARIVGPDRVGRALTITSAGGVMATLFAVPAGTALSTVIGWRGAFGVLAGVGVLVAAAAGRVLPNLPGRPTAGAPRLSAVLKTPGLAGLIGTTIAVILAHFSFYTYIAPFLLRSGIAESRLGPALLVYGAMGAVGLFIAGLVIDRHLRGAMVASTAALVAVFVLLLAFGRTTVPAVVLGALTGAVMGCLPIFMQAVVVRLAPHAVETASALNASAFNAGIGGGALLGGIIVDRLNVGVLPAVSAVLASIALAVVATDRRVGRHADPTLAPAALSPAGQSEVVAT